MKYRKKPVVIEAMQMPVDLTPGLLEAQQAVARVALWMSEQGYTEETDGEVFTLPEYGSNYLEIVTLEGTMNASPGDWIIRGVQGEFYPCKPDIFDATYDRIETIITNHPEVSA